MATTRSIGPSRRAGFLRHFLRQVHRFRNALGRLRHGLPLHGESVWAGAPTDLFRAHESIYAFCARGVEGKIVLDAGCGTGYGSALLAERGACRVVGVDRHSASVRYARRRYGRPGLEFRVGDLQCVDAAFVGESPRFDRVIASNVVEHLPEPEAFLTTTKALLAPGGVLWVVVPAIVDAASLEANRANPYHVTNLFVAEWLHQFEHLGFGVTLHRHVFTGRSPDFSSPLPSRLGPESFRVEPADLVEVERAPCLGVVCGLRPR